MLAQVSTICAYCLRQVEGQGYLFRGRILHPPCLGPFLHAPPGPVTDSEVLRRRAAVEHKTVG